MMDYKSNDTVRLGSSFGKHISGLTRTKMEYSFRSAIGADASNTHSVRALRVNGKQLFTNPYRMFESCPPA